MAAEYVVSLSGLVNFFHDDPKCIAKGEVKFTSDYVMEVRFEGFKIFAKVRASMKDRSYKVGLKTDGKGVILSGSCECPRGEWICSHMAAAAIYANKKGLSKTDLPNSWIARPRKHKNQSEKVKTTDAYCTSSKPGYRATTRPVTEEDKAAFLSDLKDNDVDCPFRWLLSPETTEFIDPIAPPFIEDVLPLFASNRDVFLQKIQVTQEQRKWVAEKTKDQRQNHFWGRYRRLRLTGSNFGKVLQAIERNKNTGRPFPPSLFKSLKGEYNLQKRDAIIWGQMHEKTALAQYQVATGNQVLQSGLQLFPCGYLGCSPDGIVIPQDCSGNHGALEIKCPWKYRELTVKDMVLMEQEKNSLKDFFLTEDSNLNPKHSYWHQVQGEITSVGATWAHFVVWTKKDLHVTLVLKDPNWESINIPKLSNFYLNVLLPACYTVDD